MRGIYKKIGIVIIVLLLGVGSAILWQSSWQSSKQTKTETRSAAQVKQTLQNIEYPFPDQRKHQEALLDKYLKDAEATIDPQISLAYKERLQASAEYLQKLAEDATQREKRTEELLNFVSEHVQRYERRHEDRKALNAHRDKVLQEGEVLRRKADAIKPLLDRLEDNMQSFLDSTSFLDASSAEKVSETADSMPHDWTPDTFRDSFTKQVLDWDVDFEDQYLDVVVSQSLSPEEFDEFFPTDASRAELRVRQQEMHADIARRVQGLLAEDTGNREEKLSIIRQTLSENWSPDIADGVLERLK